MLSRTKGCEGDEHTLFQQGIALSYKVLGLSIFAAIVFEELEYI